ncbi:MAG: hypothetical protein ABGY71_12020 [bacterium]|jgi:hypothetical protein|nr:hypothetical protein [Planctomycetota bacterium]HIL51069.1 hypothetical protein [Planctomycetota bacterium]
MTKTAIVLLLASLTGIAGWWTYMVRTELLGQTLEIERQEELIGALEGDLTQSREHIGELDAEVALKKRRILELEMRLALLKVDHRVARIEVVDQWRDPSDHERITTTVRFIEFGRDGEPLGPGQEITLEGTTLYLETLVVKFDDEFVEAGEFLRGTSLCLFRRMFSETVAPNDGVPIDEQGTQPYAYTGGDGPDEIFHAELWQNFWEYANDPEAAAKKGVRAIHGEAPFIEVRPGRCYRIELRSSAGLSISPE